MIKKRTKKKLLIEVDAEILDEIADLERRSRETDRQIEETLKRADEVQRSLRAIYQRR